MRPGADHRQRRPRRRPLRTHHAEQLRPVLTGVASNGSIGYGNYNAGFASLKMADWRGLTLQSNFTWSKALGTGADVQATSEYTPDDPFNLGTTYGYQNYNRKFVYNAFFVYQPAFFKGQHGLMGRALGGWSFASVFTAGSGSPIEIGTSTGDGQEYGAGDNIDFFGNENAIQIAPIAHGHAYYNNPSGALPVNMFKEGISPLMTSAIRFWVWITRMAATATSLACPTGTWTSASGRTSEWRKALAWNFKASSLMSSTITSGWIRWPSPLGFTVPVGFRRLSGSAQEQPAATGRSKLGLRVRF